MKARLYLLCGLPGSGKTTFAKELQKQTGAVIFNIDKEVMTRYGILNNQSEYEKSEKEVKKELYRQTKSLLLDNKPVILDFGFWKKSDRERYIKLAKSLKAHVVVYYFDRSCDVLLERLKSRNKNLPKNSYLITQKMLDKFIKNFEPPTPDETELVAK